jgi:hypothetical protein
MKEYRECEKKRIYITQYNIPATGGSACQMKIS